MFTNDNPLNATDPLGQCGGWFGFVCKAFDATRHFTYQYRSALLLGVVTVAAFTVTGGLALALAPSAEAVVGIFAGETTVGFTLSDVVMNGLEVLSSPMDAATLAAKVAAPMALTGISGAATLHEVMVASRSRPTRRGPKKKRWHSIN